MAAVERYGSLRDRTLIVVGLHTGLRSEELCGLKPSHVKMAKRSGHLKVWGKRGKYREVPLNATAREALARTMLPGARAVDMVGAGDDLVCCELARPARSPRTPL